MQTHEEQCTQLRETVAILRDQNRRQYLRIQDSERALDRLAAQVRELAQTNEALRRRLELTRR